jgi:putative sterol carrier protein
MGKIERIEDMFTALSDRILETKVANERATIQLELSGDHNVKCWLRVEDGAYLSGEGDAPYPPDVTLAASSDDWFKVLNFELSATLAVIQGKLKVRGDKAIAIRMQDWFSR